MEVLEMTVETRSSEGRERLFEELYEKTFPAFARFASTMNASFEDARDVFHDALVVYYEKTMDDTFSVRTTPEAYVLGIARHLWLRKFRANRREISLQDAGESFVVPSDFYPDKKELRLLNFLERAGKRCLDLLRKFYFEQSSLKDVATSLGYGTEHSAAVQKFKCIGKLRDAVKAKAIEYEDFDY
jgi:RNA polymerase sigma factor (sigma-70 family)